MALIEIVIGHLCPRSRGSIVSSAGVDVTRKGSLVQWRRIDHQSLCTGKRAGRCLRGLLRTSIVHENIL
jgi:hypothetical protein